MIAARGIPESAIHLECASASTKENAQFTAPLLRARRARNVIIVTSWFHSRRALACFRRYAPEITFYSQSTQFEGARFWPNKYERKRIVQEYVKLVDYWVRYGISPF